MWVVVSLECFREEECWPVLAWQRLSCSAEGKSIRLLLLLSKQAGLRAG